MRKEEYIKAVTDQMRCEKAKGMIAKEIGDHIDDQAKSYAQMGMEEATAFDKAVEEMGDPIDTGVSLDRIHRPKKAWKVLLLIGIISMISVLLQYFIYKNNTIAELEFRFSNQFLYTVIGSVIMLGIYLIDYSVLGKYAREMGAIFNIFLFINIYFLRSQVNGSSSYFSIFGMNISIIMLLYLYAPIYGAILYQYRGEGYKALLKSLIWLIIPVFLALRMPCWSVAFYLFVILLLLLTVSIVKGWFNIHKKIGLFVIWGSVIALPAIAFILILNDRQIFIAEYQVARIKGFLNPYSSDIGYQITIVRKLMDASLLIGKNNSSVQTYGYLPDINSDYIITHVISYYGVLAAAVLVALIVGLISRIFKISLTQKNQLGMIMGLGCGFVYSIQLITYVLENVGLWPTGFVFLPLFSYGVTGTIVSYALLGILLSVYRYQNIIPTNLPKGKRIRFFVVEHP